TAPKRTAAPTAPRGSASPRSTRAPRERSPASSPALPPELLSGQKRVRARRRISLRGDARGRRARPLRGLRAARARDGAGVRRGRRTAPPRPPARNTPSRAAHLVWRAPPLRGLL